MTLRHVASTMTIPCEGPPLRHRRLVTTELGVTVQRETPLRVGNLLTAIPMIGMVGAMLIQTIEARPIQRTADGLELLLALHRLRERTMIMTRLLGKTVPVCTFRS